jgi:hypothetical protein
VVDAKQKQVKNLLILKIFGFYEGVCTADSDFAHYMRKISHFRNQTVVVA